MSIKLVDPKGVEREYKNLNEYMAEIFLLGEENAQKMRSRGIYHEIEQYFSEEMRQELREHGVEDYKYRGRLDEDENYCIYNLIGEHGGSVGYMYFSYSSQDAMFYFYE